MSCAEAKSGRRGDEEGEAGVPACPGRHQEEGPRGSKATWSPSLPVPHCALSPSPLRPRLAGPLPSPCLPSFFRRKRPIGRAGWGSLECGFVSLRGVGRSGPFSSRPAPGLRPRPPPHFYFKLSVAIYSYVANCGSRGSACPGPRRSPAPLGSGGPRCVRALESGPGGSSGIACACKGDGRLPFLGRERVRGSLRSQNSAAGLPWGKGFTSGVCQGSERRLRGCTVAASRGLSRVPE